MTPYEFIASGLALIAIVRSAAGEDVVVQYDPHVVSCVARFCVSPV
jgi:hypothetical protein